jgi:acetolactate decarboxylase
MKHANLLFLWITLFLIGCRTDKKTTDYNDANIVGAMKDVMWKGQLHSKIDLDTIQNKVGLYGLGPESYLTGELLILDGTGYVSRVRTDSTMTVIKTLEATAPFFVYAQVNEWYPVDLPLEVKSILDLESFIDQKTIDAKRPFAFKLEGSFSDCTIHVQNLPEGSKVSSPQEAHKGQVNYSINNGKASIIGFFSTEHQGIFTHHDSFLHMHLITENHDMMGHLDSLKIKTMTLYLPLN